MTVAERRRRQRNRRPLHPTQVVFAGFAGVAILGTALLLLPFAKAGPGAAAWNEALFTAVSALCVTGLVVVDTPTYWTPFGEAVILALIQVGGFGVMTFASFVGLVIARRLSYRGRINAATEAHAMGLADVRQLIMNVVAISVLIESIVAVVLAVHGMAAYGMGFGEAVWFGVFHGISAFNNAGFALFSDSMIQFVGDPVVNLTLSCAIILGGLGFPVIMQLRRHVARPRLWTMNTRLVLLMTLALLLVGTVLITALEWSNPDTLGALRWDQRILAGFFQSVQTRTAGFNSVDIGAMDDSTLLGMIVLMFIGGGPAGTAGGIKITTFGVLLFILLAEVRGDGVVNVLGKRLSRAVHRQAIAVVLLSVALVVGATMLLQILTDNRLADVLFESVSAFATVGLSTGITASLPPSAQVVLVVLMFVGRLGPITFATALALRPRSVAYQFPKERPIIG